MITLIKNLLRNVRRTRLENEVALQRRVYARAIRRQLTAAAKLEALDEQP